MTGQVDPPPENRMTHDGILPYGARLGVAGGVGLFMGASRPWLRCVRSGRPHESTGFVVLRAGLLAPAREGSRRMRLAVY
jgi:hypothetical protein